MRRAMEVRISWSGAAQIAKGVKATTDQLKQVNQQQAQAVKLSQQVQQTANPAKFLSGPNQRLETIRKQIAEAEKLGNTAALKDLKLAEFRANRQIALGDRAMKAGAGAPGLLELLKDLKGAGGGSLGLPGMGRIFAPGGLNVEQLLGGAAGLGDLAGLLGGKTGTAVAGAAEAASAGLLEISSVAGPLAAVFGVLTAAAAAYVAMLKRATEELAAFSAGASAAGGTASIASLRAMGLNPTDAASAGNRLRAKLSSDPMAMMFGGALPPAFLGPQDNGQFLRDQFERLRGVKALYGAEEQLRQARVLELDGYLDLINVSRHLVDLQNKEADLSKQIFTDDNLQMMRDLNGELRLNQRLYGDLATALSIPALRSTTDALHGLNAALIDIARNAQEGKGNSLTGFASGAFDAVIDALPGGTALKAIFKAFEAAGRQTRDSDNPFAADSERLRKLQDNTDALMKVAAVLKDVLGGGDRGRGALSGAQRAALARHDMKMASTLLRSFKT